MDFRAKDVFVTEKNERLRFGNGNVALEFDADTGAWLGLYWKECDGNLITPNANPLACDVSINGEWIIGKYGAEFYGYELSKSKDSDIVDLRLNYKLLNGKFIFSHILFLGQDSERIGRHLECERTNDVPKKEIVRIDGFQFSLPGIVLGSPAENVVNVPGPFFPKTYVRPDKPYEEQVLAPAIRFHSAPDAGFGIFALYNQQKNKTLLTWLDFMNNVNYIPAITPENQRLTLAFNEQTAGKLSSGRTSYSSMQVIDLDTGTYDASFVNYWLFHMDARPLDPVTPDWAREMNLLEVFPAYFKDGFKGITAKLAFYRDIGFNAIYLMPHWTGPYYGYQPNDLYAIRPEYGTKDDLKELTATAHALGMRVLFDMVIHGFDPQSKMLMQHPEFFCHTETGEIALHPTWKSATCDWASPAYQEYMAELARHDLREYDIDGYRVDAASFKGPNWDKNLPYPAYRSGTNSPDVMRHVLNALRETRPDAMLLSEVFGPVFYSVSNLGHDNQTEANVFLLEKIAAGEATAHDYKLHLANVLDLLPPGALRVVFTRNHDTSWFYHFHGYTPDVFALEAIHALCLIPEVFAGDPDHGPNPDDDATIWDTYRKLLTTRTNTPEIARGSLDLRGVETDNSAIFTALRRLNDRVVLVIVSLSPQIETAVLTFADLKPRGEILMQDVLTEETFPLSPDTFALEIRPYQVLMARFEA